MSQKNCFEGSTCQQVFPVFQQYREELLHFVNKRLQDRAQSEALVSDVLMKMHLHCEQLDQIKNIRSWLYQITRNTIHDYFRELKKIENRPVDVARQKPEVLLGTDGQESLAVLIPSLLTCLPASYAQPLQMSDLEGLPQKVIAQKMQLSVSGVKSRIQRGRQKLKALFHECLHLELDQQGVPVDFSIKPSCNALNVTSKGTAKDCSC
uniref:Sigma-70 family RNA polymerase sigma factor n=1 Tax=Roseihalotalea indica TaxID=2867963 RepID=A0AA49GM32_9BACT|nr:sigma-70 family RNA polymerase sigma factor [Tunicatimonas sp. TK19036]